MEKINRIKTIILVKLLVIILMATVWTDNCFAQKTPTLISDDETQTFLANIIKPIFEVAGISFDKNKIFIINDNSLNAFVSDGNYMFIHTGTLINADNVNQLNGILAHETGHIAGGHIARQKLRIEQLQGLSVASLVAAGAAAVATGKGDAALAIMLGSQSSLINAMTSYQMQEERSADESAIKYLRAIKQSPVGLKNFMKKIQSVNRLGGYKETPYFRTHPLSIEREEFFNQALKKNTYNSATSFDNDFKLIKAKLSAFLLPVERSQKMYPKSDKTTAGRYANAIIEYKKHNFQKGIEILDGLISEYPSNPYYHELKGQFLFESSKTKEALQSYENALKLKPNSKDIMLSWAHSALETPHDKAQLQKIITTLNRAQMISPSTTAWLLLARAYDENNQKAYSLYASAQYSVAIQNYNVAKKQIEDAIKIAPDTLKIRLNDLKHFIFQKEAKE